MAAPNNPELAVELAGKAARVSHDGEAVYAAQVVAAMVSIAFEEKDMNKVLDRAIIIAVNHSFANKVFKNSHINIVAITRPCFLTF